MMVANEEYIHAVNRASQSFFTFHTEQDCVTSCFHLLEDLHSQIVEVLRTMLVDTDEDPSEGNLG